MTQIKQPLTFAEFQEQSARTLPAPGSQHFFEKPSQGGHGNAYGDIELAAYRRNVDLLHALLGLSGEVGELIDAVKKSMFYGKQLDVENIKEEAGDVLWYFGPLCRALGVSMEELAASNVAKLRKRYPDKYTDQAAVARADKAVDPDDPTFVAGALWTPPFGFRFKPCTVSEYKQIVAKYKNFTTEEGYYFDNETGGGWTPIPELWEPLNKN